MEELAVYLTHVHVYLDGKANIVCKKLYVKVLHILIGMELPAHYLSALQLV
jgi:hypothetical protein